MTDTYKWIPSRRNYNEEVALSKLPNTKSPSNHPLCLRDDFPFVEIVKPKQSYCEDKLPAARSVFDPLLSDFAIHADVPNVKSEISLTASQDSQSKWNSKKEQILSKFHIDLDANITVGRVSLEETDSSELEDFSSKKVEVYAKRLANLERRQITNEGQIQLAHKDYILHIERLSMNLQQAWKSDEKVQALKNAIQLSKLLSETLMPKYYPTTFIKITDSLQLFGQLIYERLFSLANDSIYDMNAKTHGKFHKLNKNFNHIEIPETTKEICKNWIYKILCIRELLPRIYIEISIIRCYQFIFDTFECFPIIDRINETIRGIGNPLISNYIRAYLITSINLLFSNETKNYNDNPKLFIKIQESIYQIAHDSLFVMKSLQLPAHLHFLHKSQMLPGDYIKLIIPAMEWILENVNITPTGCLEVDSYSEYYTNFRKLLTTYEEQCNNSSLTLYCLLNTFDISRNKDFLFIIINLISSIQVDETDMEEVNELTLCNLIAIKLLSSEEIVTKEMLIKLLNGIWRIISKSEQIDYFIITSVNWMKLLVKYHHDMELCLMLQEMLTHCQELIKEGQVLTNTTTTQSLSSFIIEIVKDALVRNILDRESVLPSEGGVLSSAILIPMIELLSGTKKTSLCKGILAALKSVPSSIGDPSLLHSMLEVARILHDGIDALSPRDEVRETVRLIETFISKIDYGRDFEQQLSLYVECRSFLFKLPLILEYLIFAVCQLSMKTCLIMRNKHSKKTAAFVRACFAYCHITIPSITSVFSRLKLLILCAEVALRNQCLPQADTFVKYAISTVTEIPPTVEIEERRTVSTEDRVVMYLRQILSLLVVFPGHPEVGPFYLVRGFLSAMNRYPWSVHSSNRIRVYQDVLVLLCTLSQERFPYHMAEVMSNDSLYEGTVTYHNELNDLLHEVMDQIITLMSELREFITTTTTTTTATISSSSTTTSTSPSSAITNQTDLKTIHSCTSSLCRVAVDYSVIILQRLSVDDEFSMTFLAKLLRLSLKYAVHVDDVRYMKTMVRYFEMVMNRLVSKARTKDTNTLRDILSTCLLHKH